MGVSPIASKAEFKILKGRRDHKLWLWGSNLRSSGVILGCQVHFVGPIQIKLIL